MKSIIEFLTPQSLQENYLDYQIVNPLIFARRLNRLLRTEEIRQEFHRCAVAFDAVSRWRCLEYNNFSIYPRRTEPRNGARYLKLEDVETCDWRWSQPPGRPPLYFSQVCHGSCHQRASADLMLARRLMPDLDWVVVSAEKHTAVMAPAEQLIWDPTYFAMDVSAHSTLHTLFGKDLDDTDYDLFPEEYAFSRHTVELIHIWDLIDGYPEDKRLDIVRGMGQQLDHFRLEDSATERSPMPMPA